jgi:hypothetical protein
MVIPAFLILPLTTNIVFTVVGLGSMIKRNEFDELISETSTSFVINDAAVVNCFAGENAEKLTIPLFLHLVAMRH